VYLYIHSPNTPSWRGAKLKKIESRRTRWAGPVERVEEKRNAFKVLVGKPEGERPLGGFRCR
jgi:hypothetical protein